MYNRLTILDSLDNGLGFFGWLVAFLIFCLVLCALLIGIPLDFVKSTLKCCLVSKFWQDEYISIMKDNEV